MSGGQPLKRADVKLGFACNNNCRHCVVGDKRRRFKHRPMEELLREFGRGREQGCREVVLTGGEPTIRKDFLEVVRQAKRMGFERIQLQTNGRMMSYRGFCEQVVDAGVTDFLVALHGHVPELHDYLTRNNGNFVQTVSAIRNLKNLRQKVAVNVVVTRPNYRNIPEIATLLLRLGVDQFQMAFVHPLGNAYENFYSVVPRMALIQPHVLAGLALGVGAGVTVMTEAIPPCFLPGYEAYSAEPIMPDTMIFDAGSFIADFRKQRLTDGKAKAPSCPGCKYDNNCEGVWKEYPEKYGWAEFQPVEP